MRIENCDSEVVKTKSSRRATPEDAVDAFIDLVARGIARQCLKRSREARTEPSFGESQSPEVESPANEVKGER
jgi:hypothetical protein